MAAPGSEAAPSKVRLAGFSLNVRSGGAGARHFLCLHGLVDNLTIWRKIAPDLETRGRVYRIDQRGHGESDSPPGPYARADLAADVIACMDAAGVDKTILVGHSMGGIVSMATALEYPDRIAGLVLIGSTSECREKVAGWYERIALAGEEAGIAGLAAAIYGKDSKKQIRGDAQGISHVTRMLKSLFSDPLTPRLANISCPVLVIVGEKDPMGPKASEIIHAALEPGRSAFVALPGRGHWLHVEAVDEVVTNLDSWLEQHNL